MYPLEKYGQTLLPRHGRMVVVIVPIFVRWAISGVTSERVGLVDLCLGTPFN